jgi:hypothetical protein
MSTPLLDKKIAWVEAIRAGFHAGKPEPAWDQAGELLDLLAMALEEAKFHSDVLDMIEQRLRETSPPVEQSEEARGDDINLVTKRLIIYRFK